MSAGKLLEIVESLNRNEIRKLGEFLQSPYFNKSNRMRKIFRYFKKYTKNGKVNFNKKTFLQSVFEKDVVNDSAFRIALSDYTKLLNKFILINKNEFRYLNDSIILLEEFRLRGAFKNYKILSKSLANDFNKLSLKSIEDYFLFAMFHDSGVMFTDNKLKTRKPAPYLQTIDCHEHLFMLAKLHYQNLHLIGLSPLPKNFSFSDPFFEIVVKQIEKNITDTIKNHLLIYLEYLILDMLVTRNSYTSYKKLLKIVLERYKSLDINHLTHIYFSFNAKCINEVSENEESIHYSRFFNVISIFFKIGFFDNYQQLPFVIFYNSIDVAIRLNEINFAEHFFESYSQKIDESISSGIVFFPKALILIHRKKYDEAIKCLSMVKSVNTHVYLKSRFHLARLYYELGYYENLFYIVDSSKHYLNRNKTELGLRFNLFSNFFNFINNLARVEDYNLPAIHKLKSKILASENVAGKDWLIERIEALLAINKHKP